MAVLSERSKRNLDLAFQKVAKATLARAGDSCDVAPRDAGESAAAPISRLLVVTISSFAFRLMTIFRITDSPAVRAYYMGEAARELGEVFAETANLCCGMLSGELAHTISHIGMSIPYELNGQCIGYLAELQPQHLSHFLITINESVQLQATLCMCCSAPVEVEINLKEDERERGSLELF